ncbi:MAG: nucleotidyltransferase domain-containing protein [Ginsengibacter sp.]
MYLIASNTIPPESKTVAALVKKEVIVADTTASVILFGSRARGDAESDSDWDFLVLTQHTNTDLLSDKLRKIMLRKVEL